LLSLNSFFCFLFFFFSHANCRLRAHWNGDNTLYVKYT
jgi:hypothetical protein